GLAAGMLGARSIARGANAESSIKLVAFDGFAVFDPTSVATRCEGVFPGQGKALATAWRTRQFEYTWLRTLSRQYVDFWKITKDALTFAAHSLKLDLTLENRERLARSFLEMKAYPDVAPALERLKGAGVKLAFLSNMTMSMLDTLTKASGLDL